MNEQNEPAVQPAGAKETALPKGGELQFDRAEYVGQPNQPGQPGQPGQLARKCFICKGEIRDAYYSLNGKTACAACHARFVEQHTGGSGKERFLRAASYGLIAGVMGSAIYYAIIAFSGYQIGIISILVGWMVGKAVSNGSGRRGGWVYQLLAICLTYLSIVSSFVPLIVKKLHEQPSQNAAVTVKSRTAKAPAATSGAAEIAAVQSGETKTEPAKTMEPADNLGNKEEHAAATRPAPVKIGLLGFVILIFVALALPFIVGLHSPMMLIIIGIGLYEAWALNKRPVINITGPFPVTPPPPVEASPSGA